MKRFLFVLLVLASAAVTPRQTASSEPSKTLREQSETAVASYTKAIAADPKSADAYYGRGAAFLKLNQYPQAVADFTKAIELNPQFADAYLNRGIAYDATNERTKAIADYSAALALKPKYAYIAYFNRGNDEAALGKTEDAKNDLLKALELNAALDAHVKAIYARYKWPPPPIAGDALTEDIHQAIKNLGYPDQLAGDFTRMVAGWGLLSLKQRLSQAKGEYQQGSLTQARLAETEKRAINDLSQTVRTHIRYKKIDFDLANIVKDKYASCIGYSVLLYVLGNAVGLPVKAIRVQELAVGTLPSAEFHAACLVTLTDGKSMMVDLVRDPIFVSDPFVFGEAYREAGNHWELISVANPLAIHRRIQLLDERGVAGVVCDCRGIISRQQGRFEDALAECAKAVKFNPKDAVLYYNLGVTYERVGRHAEAAADYTKAIELDPKYAAAHYARGAAYSALGRHDEAMLDYNDAIRLNPRDATAYSFRGVTYGRQGQYDKAIADLSAAIRLRPNVAETYYSRGIVHARKGEIDKAIADWTEAIRLDPKDAKLYHNRGVAFSEKGEKAKAADDFARAKKLGYTSP
jgi:tetratricopeptide (TPR) repeat protein